MLYFDYQAHNSAGDSVSSDEAAFALAAYPSSPINVAKVDASSSLTSIYLEWDVVADYEVNVIGYRVYMDTGGDGNFQLLFDGHNQPGINHFEATGLQTGGRYRFKVAALNFNGEGDASEEIELFSCLPPTDILPPVYVSSTETTLTLDWSHPMNLYGCPLTQFELWMDDGASGEL